EEGVARLRRGKVETDEGATDAFARLVVIEIANGRIPRDVTGEEVVERAGTLVEVEPEKSGMAQQIAPQRNGPEIDIDGSGEIFPGKSRGIEKRRHPLENRGVVGREG